MSGRVEKLTQYILSNCERSHGMQQLAILKKCKDRSFNE
mgnify:CR=1 FL=1